MKNQGIRLAAILLALTLVFSTALAETNARPICYNNMKLMGSMLSGEQPGEEIVDSSFDGMLVLVIEEGKAGVPGSMQAIGPNAAGDACITSWTLGEDPNEALDLLYGFLSWWDTLAGSLADGEFQLLYLSERLASGSLVIHSREDVQTILAAAQDHSADAPPQDTSLILPSMDSFAGFRLNIKEDEFKDGPAYQMYYGFASKPLAKQFAEDYIQLLTEDYSFKLVKTEDEANMGLYINYYLDYTGDASIRPVSYRNFSGEVILYVRIDNFSYGPAVYLMYSSGLTCQETDDRTTVNIQNR